MRSDLMKGTGITPAGQNLFMVDGNAVKLTKEAKDQFHQSVAQPLFLSKRAPPDFQTAVAFLCTWVQSPDVNNNKKLGRVMRHLRETIELPLVLGWDRTGNICWSVNASLAVHQDTRSYTSSVMTFGSNAFIAMSTKQKLNAQASTHRLTIQGQISASQNILKCPLVIGSNSNSSNKSKQ